MKTKTSLYTVIAACTLSWGMPLSGWADDQAAKTRKTVMHAERPNADRPKPERAKASRESRARVVQRRAITGSHLPQEYRKAGPNVDTPQKVSVYDRHDLEKTGNLSVGSSLKRLDPSITIRNTP